MLENKGLHVAQCNNSEIVIHFILIKVPNLDPNKTFYLLFHAYMYFLLYVFYDFMCVISCCAIVS
jgi:hypothetical protein